MIYMPVIKFKKNRINIEKASRIFNIERFVEDSLFLELPSNRIDLLYDYFVNIQALSIVNIEFNEKIKDSLISNTFETSNDIDLKNEILLDFLNNLCIKYFDKKTFKYFLTNTTINLELKNFSKKEENLIKCIIWLILKEISFKNTVRSNTVLNLCPIILPIDKTLLETKLNYYNKNFKDVESVCGIKIKERSVILPFYRIDITDQDEIIEDLLIRLGYENLIEKNLKVKEKVNSCNNEMFSFKLHVRRILQSLGLQELYLNKLISADYEGIRLKNAYSKLKNTYNFNFQSSVKKHIFDHCTNNFFTTEICNQNEQLIMYCNIVKDDSSEILRKLKYWAFLKDIDLSISEEKYNNKMITELIIKQMF